MQGRSDDATTRIGSALDAWAAAMPAGAATVERADGRVTFTACDTGAAVPDSQHPADQILAVAAGRDALYAALVNTGAPSNASKCAADALVRDPAFAPLLENPDQVPDQATLDRVRARATAIAADCRRSTSS
jgi:hypothetical protein